MLIWRMRNENRRWGKEVWVREFVFLEMRKVWWKQTGCSHTECLQPAAPHNAAPLHASET